MAITKEQEVLAKCLQKCGIEKQTVIVLMIALRNNQERMRKVANYLIEQEKKNSINPDQIIRQVMKIAMTKTIE